MALISLKEISLGFGGPLLLDSISLQIEQGESVGLLGRNGMGKSTLLKLLSGDLAPGSGSISRQQNLRIAYLPQEVPQELTGSVYDIVSAGLAGDQSEKVSDEHWKNQLQIEQIISRMQIDSKWQFSTLSAGLKRRVLLARGLVKNPELLLLDEPTNHLDIESIEWLEDFLKRWTGTLMFVTHDRAFLKSLATRIIELDRGQLYDWNCDYQTFLQRKDAVLTSETQQNLIFDKKLALEEQWIRKGIEARRTRNEGRVRALKKLRDLRQKRRDRPGKINLQIQADRVSGELVIQANSISYSYGSKIIARDFSTIIQRGDKVGIIGSNGSGKTTLLRLLLGELSPTSGTIEFGTNLKMAYYDQLRAQLDETKSIQENVAQGADSIMINGKPRNIISYLADFLFDRDRIHAPISALSGGERNRLLLARIFAQPTNLLIMDEPTNDLDIESLEILEDMLMDFRGTLLLVSHDRAFLNNLVTSTLVLDGSGTIKEYVGGYDDWKQQSLAENNEKSNVKEKILKSSLSPAKLPKRPGNKELLAQKQELDELPRRIEKLEAEHQTISQKMSDPAFYKNDKFEIARNAARLKEIDEALALAYQRWEALENT